MPYERTTVKTTKTITNPNGSKTVTTHVKAIYKKLVEIIEKKRPGNPAQDFYTFANYEWLNDPNVVIPAEYPSWGSFIALFDASLKNQVGLLQELVAADLEGVDGAICGLGSGKWNGLTDSDVAPVHEALATLEAHLATEASNDDDALARYLALSQELGIASPIAFDIVPDFADPKNNLLSVGAAGLSLPSRDFYFEDNFKEKREFFIAHLNNVAQLVGADRLVEDFAEAVLRFETRLAFINMKSDQARKYTEFYTTTTLDGIINGINDLSFLDEKLDNYGLDSAAAEVSEEEKVRIGAFLNCLYDKLNLRSTLAANYAANYPEGTKKPERIIVFDGDYFQRIFAVLFNEDNREDLKAYLQYKAIRATSSFSTKALDAEFFDLYNRKLRGQKEAQSAEKRTVALVNEWVGFLFGKIYVARYFSEADKETVSQLIREVTAVMDESIANNDWMTAATKEQGRAKLQKFKQKIGFPDKWKEYDALLIEAGDSLWNIKKKVAAHKFNQDFLRKVNSPVDKTEWFMTPQTVNAYYSPLDNEICFPAAIIQPPFYYKAADQVTFQIEDADREALNNDELLLAAVNFGAISAVIAHEITHGFDDQGRAFDGEGAVRDWWTEEDANLFKAKCDLMEKQDWSFFESSTKKFHFLNPKLTMGENLADLGGISLSVQALEKRLAQAGVTPEGRLAALRIFFSSWANGWKEKASDAFIVNQLASDPHAPGHVRGNLVKNIDQFYEAYEVKEGDAMYIAKENRVQMW
ncbi:zincin [Rhizoclosmatium globosum]|uniref:Zincin n=1 Tax=Rhizoclosmatium globosum TaxID=329046 RepID=A0A1Y2C5Q0_9FUNG|nr:zincin [Rhizoclosmatium globosum]|eukprot:ORY42363.1 zincin [Rhizoclosmatium globosum]